MGFSILYLTLSTKKKQKSTVSCDHMTEIRPYHQGGTPSERWNSFQLECSMRTKPPNTHSQKTVDEVKKLLQTINPETGFLYGGKEVAKKLGIGRYSVTKIDMDMRKEKWRASKKA